MVVAVDDPRVAAEQAALVLAPLAVVRCNPAGLPEMEVEMNDGQACLHSQRAEKVLFPDPAIPVTTTRRPIVEGASPIDFSVPHVSVGSHAGRRRLDTRRRDPIVCSAQQRGPARAAKHAPQPCFARRDAHFPGWPLHTNPGLSSIKALDEALASFAGVPESQLSRHVAAGLPDSAPGPPWDCRVSSVFWLHRAKPGASEALSEVLRGSPRVAVTIGALIRYIDSPVGPYREIIAVPALVRRPFPQANVAFIAVDSEASVVGGRANWALPKVLARFEGTIGLQGDATVVGPDWTVRVATRSRPLRLPTWLRYSCCQLWPDLTVRHFPLKVQGWSRWATVDVEVSSSGTLGTWLASGRYTGFTFAGHLRGSSKTVTGDKGDQHFTEGEPARDARWTREGDASHSHRDDLIFPLASHKEPVGAANS